MSAKCQVRTLASAQKKAAAIRDRRIAVLKPAFCLRHRYVCVVEFLRRSLCRAARSRHKQASSKAADYPYLKLPIMVNLCKDSTPLIGNAVAFAALPPVAQFGAIGKPNGAQLPAIGAVPQRMKIYIHVIAFVNAFGSPAGGYERTGA